MKKIRNRLVQLIYWSDRLGSDEIGEINEIIKLIDELPNYKKGFEEVMCYFDSISDEEQPKLSKRLEKLGL